jgi:hypothetical protein
MNCFSFRQSHTTLQNAPECTLYRSTLFSGTPWCTNSVYTVNKRSTVNYINRFFAGFAVVCCIISCMGCSLTEVTPSKPEGDWQLLVATDENPTRYAVLSQPDNLVINPNLFLATDSIRGIGGRVTKIIVFRDNLYAIIPDQRKIEILSATTYKRLATLDFTTVGRTPSDIVFGNSTTGFIAFSDATVLGVLDTRTTVVNALGVSTNFSIPRTIEVGRNPVALEVRDNQIFCAVRGDNVIIQIDNSGRDPNTSGKVVARIPVAPAPQFLRLNATGDELLVLSAGGGRFDNSPRTAVRISRISIENRRVVQEAPIFVDVADSSNELATGFVVTDRDYAFATLRTALVRLDIRNLFSRSTTLPGVFRSITYNPIRNEMLLANVDSTGTPTCVIANAETGTEALTLPLGVLRAAPRFIFSR